MPVTSLEAAPVAMVDGCESITFSQPVAADRASKASSRPGKAGLRPAKRWELKIDIKEKKMCEYFRRLPP